MNLGLIQGHIPLHETGAPPVPGEEQPRHKRNRILLSCAPCRASKLKCDRQQPCGQCAKKDRSDACEYAPKPEKKGRRRRRPAPAGGVDDDKSRGRPAPKDVTSRLKHLEGVVRDMMGAQSEGAGEADGGPSGPPGTQKLRGQVIRGQNQSTAYVGETHCMAMLEDVRLGSVCVRVCVCVLTDCL